MKKSFGENSARTHTLPHLSDHEKLAGRRWSPNLRDLK